MSDNRMICVNGHYYDGSKYDVCPHCADGMGRVEPSAFSTTTGKEKEAEETNPKKGIKLGGLFKKKSEEVIKEEPKPITETVEKKMAQPVTEDRNHNLTKGLQSVPQMMQSEGDTNNKTMGLSDNIVKEASSANVYPAPVVEKTLVETITSQPVATEQKLSTAFEQAIAPQSQEIDKSKTMSFFTTAGNTEPPVGYLICIAGEDYGTGFALKTGNNAIGRSQSMDVVIMDPKVSREKQAFVMYEPISRKFFIKPGEGSGLCYINDQIVLMPMEIHQFDKLKIGDTQLMLITVCCEQFSWDECQ